MLSIADKNQIHFIHDLYPADYIYDTAGMQLFIQFDISQGRESFI